MSSLLGLESSARRCAGPLRAPAFSAGVDRHPRPVHRRERDHRHQHRGSAAARPPLPRPAAAGVDLVHPHRSRPRLLLAPQLRGRTHPDHPAGRPGRPRHLGREPHRRGSPGPAHRDQGLRRAGDAARRVAGAGPDARAGRRRPGPAGGRAHRPPALGGAVRPVARRCSERRSPSTACRPRWWACCPRASPSPTCPPSSSPRSGPAADPRRNERGSNFLRVIAHLAPGATVAQARQEMADITADSRRPLPRGGRQAHRAARPQPPGRVGGRLPDGAAPARGRGTAAPPHRHREPLQPLSRPRGRAALRALGPLGARGEPGGAPDRSRPPRPRSSPPPARRSGSRWPGLARMC